MLTISERSLDNTANPSHLARRRLSRASKSDGSIDHFPEIKAHVESDSTSVDVTPPLSPLSPRTPRKQRPEALGRRLKGRCALRLNDSALRKYTDYDASGMPRSPFFSPGMWTGNTFGEPDIQSSLEKYEDVLIPSLPILDVYATDTVKAVLKDAMATARLQQFAESRGRAKDIDFLLQIGEYEHALRAVSSIISTISSKFTGIAATESIRLPIKLGKSLNTDVRETSTTLLPGLERLFDEAKAFVEQDLAQDVYPDFLKHQLSLNLQTIGSGYSPNQVCPGFGEAFCMTDPNDNDNPIVFASDGLAGLTGYTKEEMIFKNCRLFQGPGTRRSCADRMRTALSNRDEFIELVLNYTKEGRLYWNFVFMARLATVDGTTRYHLGGSVDVTEMLEGQEDITHLLSYVSPLAERALPEMDEQSRRGSCRGGQTREKRQERERDNPKYPPSASRNKFLRNFRRRHSQSETTATDSGADLSLSEPSTPMEPRQSMSFPRIPAPGHFATVSPYSRFMVLEYIESAKTSPFYDKKTSRVQLPVAFCSATALESLGPGCRDLGDVLGVSVFQVLADKAGSSCVNKSFKSTVRASLAEGRTAKLDISLGNTPWRRPRGLSLSRKHSGVGLTAIGTGGEMPSIHGHSLRRSLSLDRVLPVGNSSGSAQDFASHWTALKDDLGAIQWVVLVLVPVLA